MSSTSHELYTLAGRLVDIERAMAQNWTFKLVCERDDLMRDVTNLGRRERSYRPRVRTNRARPSLTVYAT